MVISFRSVIIYIQKLWKIYEVTVVNCKLQLSWEMYTILAMQLSTPMH